MAAVACTGTPTPPVQQPLVAGPPAIPDTQPAVDFALFLGQRAFASPLSNETDFAPLLSTARVDGGNSGVVDGPSPLGVAPVTGSAELPLQPPLLWGRGGMVAGCQIALDPGLTKNCLAAVDASTLTIEARWLPAGQDLDLDSAVLYDSDRVVVATLQRHVIVVQAPANAGGTFQELRDIDLSGHLADNQSLLSVAADVDGNLWFVSGGASPTGQPAVDTTVGYVTPDDQVVTTTLPDQLVATGLAIDQEDVYLATAPAAAPVPETAGAPVLGADEGQLYDLTAATNLVQVVWHESFDAGSSVKAGATVRGSGAPVVLLGTQYLAITDNADPQPHLLIFQRGPLAPSSSSGTTTATSGATTTMTTSSTVPGEAPPPTTGDPRLVCSVALFSPGASAVTTAPIGYSSDGTNSVFVTNGYGTPPPLAGPSDAGPANDIGQMPGGMTRVDVLPDGSGCRTVWTAGLRLDTAPILSTTTGLIYGYTQDPVAAASGNYVWYFVAVDERSGDVIWQQRAGAGSTKNDDGLPTVVGANGVLYQCVPLGLVWMHDVGQHP